MPVCTPQQSFLVHRTIARAAFVDAHPAAGSGIAPGQSDGGSSGGGDDGVVGNRLVQLPVSVTAADAIRSYQIQRKDEAVPSTQDLDPLQMDFDNVEASVGDVGDVGTKDDTVAWLHGAGELSLGQFGRLLTPSLLNQVKNTGGVKKEDRSAGVLRVAVWLQLGILMGSDPAGGGRRLRGRRAGLGR
jgi:hypothetical protein